MCFSFSCTSFRGRSEFPLMKKYFSYTWKSCSLGEFLDAFAFFSSFRRQKSEPLGISAALWNHKLINPFVCILLILFSVYFPPCPRCVKWENVPGWIQWIHFWELLGGIGGTNSPGVEQREISVNLCLPPAELHLTYLLSYSASNILNKSLFVYAQPELQFFQSILHFATLILMYPWKKGLNLSHTPNINPNTSLFQPPLISSPLSLSLISFPSPLTRVSLRLEDSH